MPFLLILRQLILRFALNDPVLLGLLDVRRN